MYECEICKEMRPSPCVGIRAVRNNILNMNAGPVWGKKPPAVIKVCPFLNKGERRGDALVFTILDVRMEDDMCLMGHEHVVPLAQMQTFVPGFGVDEETLSAFIRAHQLAMGQSA